MLERYKKQQCPSQLQALKNTPAVYLCVELVLLCLPQIGTGKKALFLNLGDHRSQILMSSPAFDQGFVILSSIKLYSSDDLHLIVSSWARPYENPATNRNVGPPPTLYTGFSISSPDVL